MKYATSEYDTATPKLLPGQLTLLNPSATMVQWLGSLLFIIQMVPRDQGGHYQYLPTYLTIYLIFWASGFSEHSPTYQF